jgi:hypothetical protein
MVPIETCDTCIPMIGEGKAGVAKPSPLEKQEQPARASPGTKTSEASVTNCLREYTLYTHDYVVSNA